MPKFGICEFSTLQASFEDDLQAYRAAEHIQFDGMQLRRDVAAGWS